MTSDDNRPPFEAEQKLQNLVPAAIEVLRKEANGPNDTKDRRDARRSLEERGLSWGRSAE